MAKFLVGGFVYDGSGTSKKLEGVKIYSDAKQTTTNKDGYYEIELDTNDDFQLTAEKDGYLGISKRVKKEKGDITLLVFNLQKELQLSQKPETKEDVQVSNLSNEEKIKENQKQARKEQRQQKRAETPKSSYLIGGLSGVALGTTAYLMSSKVSKSKWVQLGLTTASAVIFYFIGFNISNFVSNRNEIKNQ